MHVLLWWCLDLHFVADYMIFATYSCNNQFLVIWLTDSASDDLIIYGWSNQKSDYKLTVWQMLKQLVIFIITNSNCKSLSKAYLLHLVLLHIRFKINIIAYRMYMQTPPIIKKGAFKVPWCKLHPWLRLTFFVCCRYRNWAWFQWFVWWSGFFIVSVIQRKWKLLLWLWL